MSINLKIIDFLERNPGSHYKAIAEAINKPPKETTSKLTSLKHRQLVYNENMAWYAGKQYDQRDIFDLANRLAKVTKELSQIATALVKVSKTIN